MEDNQNSNFFSTAISSYGNLTRFIILICLAIIVAGLTTWLLLKKLNKDKSDLNVSFSENGATLIINSSGSKALFLLPASAAWLNTGIEIENNSSLIFTTSGKVNLGINNLVKSAEANTKPRSIWTDPIGYNVSLQAKDRMRTNILVKPESKLGTVIGFIQKPGDVPPGENNPRPPSTFEVQNNKTFTSSSKGQLWLSVNDFLMSPKERELSKQAFIGESIGRERKEREKEFENIENQAYWNLWFDDNIGEYLIQIDIKR